MPDDGEAATKYKANSVVPVINEDGDQGLDFWVGEVLRHTSVISGKIETKNMQCYGFYGSVNLYAAKCKAMYMPGKENLWIDEITVSAVVINFVSLQANHCLQFNVIRYLCDVYYK